MAKKAARLAHQNAVKLVETPPSTPLKLDLACGLNVCEGFEGVDLYGDKAKHKVDLLKFPWPFKDASVDELHCSHFLEHIHAREVEDRDLAASLKAGTFFLGQDMLFAFMDEAYRILKPDSWMTVIVPSGRSNRAFQDPTHRRFFVQETFLYFAEEWRKMNGLSHYRSNCNFACNIVHTLPQEEMLRSSDAQQERFQHYWNVTIDWVAKLKKLPRLA